MLGVLTIDPASSVQCSTTRPLAATDSAGDNLDAVTEIIRDGCYRVMLAPSARVVGARVGCLAAARWWWWRYCSGSAWRT